MTDEAGEVVGKSGVVEADRAADPQRLLVLRDHQSGRDDDQGDQNSRQNPMMTSPVRAFDLHS